LKRAKLLTKNRRKLLVFWYQYHKDTNFWPTYSEASLELSLSRTTIKFHVDVLVSAEWMAREGKNRQIALTKQGEKQIYQAELISLGEVKREPPNLAMNKMKKRHG
jgi:hypothetical protein